MHSESQLSAVPGNLSMYKPMITAATGTIESTDLAKTVQSGIARFFEGMPLFMKALDEVAKVHPFVRGIQCFRCVTETLINFN